MATVTKTIQYQQDDGSWTAFDPSVQSDLSRTSVLVDMDAGSYQVRIPGWWSQQDIDNTIASEVSRYDVQDQQFQQQVQVLDQVAGS